MDNKNWEHNRYIDSIESDTRTQHAQRDRVAHLWKEILKIYTGVSSLKPFYWYHFQAVVTS
jgi:hypothetical protein